MSHWEEHDAPADLGQLLCEGGPDWVGKEEDNMLQVDENGFVIVDEKKDGGLLLDWPMGKRFIDVHEQIPTRADVWALHRFVFQELKNVECICSRPVDGHYRRKRENMELGQAATSLRPALLALATPGMLTAQDVRKGASSGPRLVRTSTQLEAATDVVA